MSFEIDGDSAAAQADNVTSLDHEPEFDAWGHALNILGLLMPDLDGAVESGRTSFGDHEKLLDDIACILELIRSIDGGDDAATLADSTIPQAAWLALRMLYVAKGNHRDPKAWEIIREHIDAAQGAEVLGSEDGPRATEVKLTDRNGDLVKSWIVRHETVHAVRNRN